MSNFRRRRHVAAPTATCLYLPPEQKKKKEKSREHRSLTFSRSSHEIKERARARNKETRGESKKKKIGGRVRKKPSSRGAGTPYSPGGTPVSCAC